jgi:hypothetical protein
MGEQTLRNQQRVFCVIAQHAVAKQEVVSPWPFEHLPRP